MAGTCFVQPRAFPLLRRQGQRSFGFGQAASRKISSSYTVVYVTSSSRSTLTGMKWSKKARGRSGMSHFDYSRRPNVSRPSLHLMYNCFPSTCTCSGNDCRRPRRQPMHARINPSASPPPAPSRLLIELYGPHPWVRPICPVGWASQLL